MKFLDLVAQISEVDGAARVSAGRSLQQILSLRNWIIGASIVGSPAIQISQAPAESDQARRILQARARPKSSMEAL